MSDFDAAFEMDCDTLIWITEAGLTITVFGMPLVATIPLKEIIPQLERILETAKMLAPPNDPQEGQFDGE